MKIGKVKSLWRYPVKSLMGECLNDMEIDDRGVTGDRLYAVSDSGSKFGSGKDTRRFRRMDGLFSMAAKTSGNGVSIEFPDGKVLLKNDASINSKLSQTIGQTVTLSKERDVSHFDDGAIHILTTSSLSLLADLLPQSDINIMRFRPNIVLDCQYTDEDLIGKTIKIGKTILKIIKKTVRCRMITIEQPGIENRPEILKSISKNFGLGFGVYATVKSTGPISVGDKVEFIPSDPT